VTRKEIIARLMLCIEHPFGGHGQPKRGAEVNDLVEQLLALPGDGPQTARYARNRAWSEDDQAAVRVLAFHGAPLEQTAVMLGREAKQVVARADQIRGLKLPPEWLQFRNDQFYGGARSHWEP
jgi:hypothetical protein